MRLYVFYRKIHSGGFVKMMAVRFLQWLGFSPGPLLVVGEGADAWWRRISGGAPALTKAHLKLLKAMKAIARHHLGPEFW